jgi:CheY-like chemotaxis protein
VTEVVDDDAANRALATMTLTNAGYDVLEAEGGERGLEIARSERPDLAVLDVRMPGLNGFELAEALRGDSLTHAIPIVFVSAETGADSYERARGVGAAGYLPKPFDPRVLEALVAVVAGGGRSLGTDGQSNVRRAARREHAIVH